MSISYVPLDAGNPSFMQYWADSGCNPKKCCTDAVSGELPSSFHAIVAFILCKKQNCQPSESWNIISLITSTSMQHRPAWVTQKDSVTMVSHANETASQAFSIRSKEQTVAVQDHQLIECNVFCKASNTTKLHVVALCFRFSLQETPMCWSRAVTVIYLINFPNGNIWYIRVVRCTVPHPFSIVGM